METKINPWKANLTNGLILGLIGIVYSLTFYFLDMSLNKSIGNLFYILAAILLFFFIKSYRDNYLYGNITYGQSVGAGVIIFLYYSIISAIFAYILFAIIDPGLIDKMLAMAEEQMIKSGKVPEDSFNTAMKFQKKFLQPGVISILSVFANMIYGTLVSLFVSIFTRKEGNPLIENASN